MSVPALSIVDIFDIFAFRHTGPQMSSGFILKFFLIMKKMITEDIRRRFLYDCFDSPQDFISLKQFGELNAEAMSTLDNELLNSMEPIQETKPVYRIISEDTGLNPMQVQSPQQKLISFFPVPPGNKTNSILVKKSIFDVLLENPFSTLMLSVLFGCYHFATQLVKFLVFFYTSSKPIHHQNEFIKELEKVFHHLLSILRIPRHFADFHLYKLIELGCVLIPQNKLFFLLKERLKFMKKMHVKIRSDHSVRQEEEHFSFRKYVLSCKFFTSSKLDLTALLSV
jgi:hypothetical protein